MQKFVQYIPVLFLAACISACGGSGTSATAPTPIYKLPPVLASTPANPLVHTMGGSVQGTPLTLGNTVATLAGTAGSFGFGNFSTTNGPPAKFNQPNDITTDGINFYVADYMNNFIRKVTPSGEVRTISDPVSGFPLVFNRPSGITTDGTNLYVVANGSNTVSFININTNAVTTIGSTTGLAGSVDVAVVPPATTADVTLARFNRPTGVTTDGINLYVTDSGNHTVRWIDIATKAVSTLAGTSGAIGSLDGGPTVARFNLPGRITTDGASLYLTDVVNRTIRQIDMLTGAVTTLAGTPGPVGPDRGTLDGIGKDARFYQPNGITTDGANLYVTDSYWNTIRQVNLARKEVTTIPLPAGSLHTPTGITTDGKSLFAADTFTVSRDPKSHLDTFTYSNSILNIQ